MGITWKNLTNKGTQASRHHAVSNTWQGSLIQNLNHIRKVKQLIQSIHVNSISRLSVSFCQGSSQQIQNPDIVRLIAIVEKLSHSMPVQVFECHTGHISDRSQSFTSQHGNLRPKRICQVGSTQLALNQLMGSNGIE